MGRCSCIGMALGAQGVQGLLQQRCTSVPGRVNRALHLTLTLLEELWPEPQLHWDHRSLLCFPSPVFMAQVTVALVPARAAVNWMHSPSPLHEARPAQGVNPGPILSQALMVAAVWEGADALPHEASRVQPGP